MYIQDITQAYTQSKTLLSYVIYTRPLLELVNEFLPSTVFKIVKPLYSITEARNHWFRTYYSHYYNELGIEPSTYDLCLLTTIDKEGPFRLVSMQTDNTLFLGNEHFTSLKEYKIYEKKLLAKGIEKLSQDHSLSFNRCKLSLNKSTSVITILQKDQGKRIELINPKSSGAQLDYCKQRARSAYVASVY